MCRLHSVVACQEHEVIIRKQIAAQVMCGRYSLITDIGELADRFEFDGDCLGHTPSYNIAPTQMALTVTNGDGRRASRMRWGLIPSWSKSASVGNRMIVDRRR